MEDQQRIIGAIKIKDGLFIGDEYAAQDLEFIVTNKVTHVINCAGQNIGNVWEQIGVMYLTFPWTQSDQQILFDEQDEILNEIVKFIDEAAEVGESTLVHSIKGQSRACCVLAAYFMKKYNWALLKTLEFLNSRRPELEIRSSFFNQLTNLSKKLQNSGTGAMIQDWHDSSYNNNGVVLVDQLIIRNTFLNSRNAPIADIFQDEQLQMQMINKEKKDILTWNDIHHKRELHIAVIPNPSTFNPIQHYRQSSQNKKIMKPCLKKGGIARSMSGRQVGVIGPQLKYNKSAKSLVEDTPQVGNQHSFLLNSSLQKTDISSSNNVSNSNFYSNNNSNQINQNSLQSNQIAGLNSQQSNPTKSNSFYQQQQQTQIYGSSLPQQSSFHQQQPLLSQQIRNLQQQLPISSLTYQPNQVGISSQSLSQDRQSIIQSQQYQQINSYQQQNSTNSQLQSQGNNNYLNNNFMNNTYLNNNNNQSNNINTFINSSTSNNNQNISNNIININKQSNSSLNNNNNNSTQNTYSNENKQGNITTSNQMTNNTQQIKNEGQNFIKTLNITSSSSKNTQSSYQNALTLNSGNSGSKSISQSALTSPYNQKNIVNVLSNTVNDKKNIGTGSTNNSGSKNNKMMPPQSASMQEKKQNIISKIIEQQPSLSSSTTNASSSLIRSNSLRAFVNEKEQQYSKQNIASSKNTIQTYLNPQISNKPNLFNQSSNASSNTSILQKNNTSFGSQLGNDQQTTTVSNTQMSNQVLSTQIQSGYRSNSLPKRLEDERSPSSKLSYQLQNSNRPSSVSTKEKQDNLLQQQKNQFSFLNNEMKNSLIQQNEMDKPRLQQSYGRTSSANNDQEQNNTSFKPTSNHLNISSQNKQTPNNIIGIKSPVSSSKAGYIKNERPVKLYFVLQPLKPREQTSLSSTTNNKINTINTPLNKPSQQQTLNKFNTNSNVNSSQTQNSDSNRYSTNTFNQFTNSINTSSIGSNQELKANPSASSLTQAIQNKITNNTNNSLINSDSSRANNNRYNNIPSSSTNKSPINGGPSVKSSLTSKPPQSKLQQSFDKNLKENYNIQPYTVYQPMQNNFMESSKLKESITMNTPSSLVKSNIGKTNSSYRSFSPDIQSLQNKLDKQKQIGSSKNRIRSNSPGQALTYNVNNTSSTQFNQIQNLGSQNVFADQKIDYLKQQNNINPISSESDNIFTLTNGLLDSNISSSKPRWKF